MESHEPDPFRHCLLLIQRHSRAGFYGIGGGAGGGIARRGWQLVYGGNRVGMMKSLADACRESGGRVVGITPRAFIDMGIGDTQCDELIVADNMRHRKQLLEQRGDALIALPGGLGTLEEFFEVLVARQLGQHSKPIVLLDIDGYYRPLLAMIDHGIELQFIKPQARNRFYVADSVAAVLNYLAEYVPLAGESHEEIHSASE